MYHVHGISLTYMAVEMDHAYFTPPLMRRSQSWECSGVVTA